MSKDHISMRSMNFGQHWRTENVKEYDYEISLPLNFVKKFIQAELYDLIEDCKAHPDSTDELENLLRTDNWPTSCDQIFASENKNLQIKLLEFHSHEILLEWFGDKPKTQNGYVLNSVDNIELIQDFIMVIGKCRGSESDLKYQDF